MGCDQGVTDELTITNVIRQGVEWRVDKNQWDATRA